MIDVTVIIATCGSETWRQMGDQALQSALATGARTIRWHDADATVAEARNTALKQVHSEYVVFLDADDDLDPNYFTNIEPTTDVTATMISYGGGSFAQMPMVWQHENYVWKRHEGYCTGACLVDGNWIHVGAICKTAAVKAVGGFREFPVYEDWALFLSMQQNGATFSYTLNSIYRASVRENGTHRNASMPLEERNIVHEDIIKELVRG